MRGQMRVRHVARWSGLVTYGHGVVGWNLAAGRLLVTLGELLLYSHLLPSMQEYEIGQRWLLWLMSPLCHKWQRRDGLVHARSQGADVVLGMFRSPLTRGNNTRNV